MLKSVDEVSSELGVSKTAIYNKLKLKVFKDKLVKKQGKIMIDEGLFNLIQDSLKVKNEETEDPYVAKDLDRSFNLNEEFISNLQNQIKEKDKQIAQLHDLLSKSQSLIENNQVLLKQQQDKEIKTLQLEQHFAEVDEKLLDLRHKMESKKQPKRNFFKFFKK